MKLNLNRNKRYAIPIMTHPGIELIEKTVKAAVTDGQTHADAIIALSENTPSDAATVIMDLTVEAEAFGAKLHFSENDVPSVAERLLHDRNEVENLRIPDTDTARILEYLKATDLRQNESMTARSLQVVSDLILWQVDFTICQK